MPINQTRPRQKSARSLRVAYIVKRYPRFSETFVVNEILAHEAAGIDVSIYALRPPTDTHFQPMIARVRAPVTYLHYASVRANEFWSMLEPQLSFRANRLRRLVGAADCEGIDVFQALQLAQMLQERGVDHIHAHFATSAATVARLASLITGIPFSFTAHAKDIYHEYVNPQALAQKLADAADVVTVSDYNRDYLRQRYGCPAEKVHRIYNGLPLERFPFTAPTDRPPLILGIGRLVEKKGFNDLIQACSILVELDVELRCTIIGGGELEPALRRQIGELELDSHVQLVGPIPTDEVVKSLRDAAVLAAPCITTATGDRDGLPTVLLEAMALGTPCVASAVTGIPEVIQHEQTGLLVSERNPEQLASALYKLLVDQRLQRRIAQAARRLMEQQFDVDHNTAKLRELFANKRRQQRLRISQLPEAV